MAGRWLLRVKPGGHYMLCRVQPDDTVIGGEHSYPLVSVNQVFDLIEQQTDEKIRQQLAEMDAEEDS